MQPHYSHVRRPVSTYAFRALILRNTTNVRPFVAEKGARGPLANPPPPVVPLAPYLHSFCRSCVSETENSFERGCTTGMPDT